MEQKALICGLAGPELTDDERHYIADHRPWGFILFARNVVEPEQVRDLTGQLHHETGRDVLPILVDQEGGRVQRLKPPHWTAYPSARALASLGEEKGARAIWLMSRLHAFDLSAVGLTVDCLPVLDVPSADGHDVIGDRAYGTDPALVAKMGRAACTGLLAGGVMPVIKHIPGHGRATSDSHLELPSVDAGLEDLRQMDFAPFGQLNDQKMAMTAHVIYSAIDSAQPATTSRKVVDTIIRTELGFDGLLMSDDVSMKALSGDFADRARAIFEAGCDCVLHCNGDMEEMKAVASTTPVLEGHALARANAALTGIGVKDGLDESECRAEFEQICAELSVV